MKRLDKKRALKPPRHFSADSRSFGRPFLRDVCGSFSQVCSGSVDDPSERECESYGGK